MRAPRPRRLRRGNTALFVAISLTSLLAMSAVVIDIGYGRFVQRQLERTSEAAAHAGTMKLDGTAEGLAAARTAAVALGERNRAAGQVITLDPNTGNDPAGDVVLGDWNPSTSTFTPSTDPALVDAVQVHAHIPELGLFVAPVALNTPTVAVGATTRWYHSSGGASAMDCYLPIAIASCLIEQHTLDGLQDVTLRLSPAGVDNIGWGRIGAAPNASWSRSQLTDCEQGGTAQVGDDVYLQNGTDASVLQAIGTAIEGSSTTWNTSLWGTQPARAGGSAVRANKYGRTLEGAILVFDGGPDYCTGSGGSYNQSEPLVGFMYAAVFDVVANGSKKNLRMRVDTTTIYNLGTDGGGPDYGVTGNSPPRLVRND